MIVKRANIVAFLICCWYFHLMQATSDASNEVHRRFITATVDFVEQTGGMDISSGDRRICILCINSPMLLLNSVPTHRNIIRALEGLRSFQTFTWIQDRSV